MIGTLFGRSRRRGRRQRPPRRTHPQVELLESRDVPSTFNLTPLVAVSGPSPFLGNPIEANDPAVTINSEVEPYVAMDPTNSNHLVGAWIQDFARGIVAAVSFNGGNAWQSVVIPGATLASGGTYPHSSDPWVSFAPNGDVYLSLLAHDIPPNGDAVLVSKSTDGGFTWGAPTAVAVAGSKEYHDKDSITADPSDSRFVYGSWCGFTPSSRSYLGTVMFSRTTNGGQTWEPARVIFDPGPHNQALGSQIVVLPDGTLVNVFDDLIFKNSGGSLNHRDFKLSLLRSSDQGQTWQSTPTAVADILPLGDTITIPGATGVPNPDGGLGIEAENWFFDVAVDPASGNLYAVWQDTRFSTGQYTSIAFSMSSDGGFTWSVPIKINQTPDNIPVGNRQAFLPSVAVNQDGVVAVTYYDFRNNTADPGLPTDLWIVHAHPADGLTNPANWSNENRLTPTSFDMEQAPVKTGYFIGDYEGLIAEGKNFGAFFSMPTGTKASAIFFRDPLPAESITEAESQAHRPEIGATMPAGKNSWTLHSDAIAGLQGIAIDVGGTHGTDNRMTSTDQTALKLAPGHTISDADGAGWGRLVKPASAENGKSTPRDHQHDQTPMDLMTAWEWDGLGQFIRTSL